MVTLFFVVVLILTAKFIISAPEGATTQDEVSSGRREAAPATSAEAIAGNVTEFDISVVTVTQTWQGYYGNITGTITLDDSDGSTFFDWALASPEGEILAANETVSWTNIRCFNYTADGGELNLSTYEETLGLEFDDVDGVDETFKAPNHPTFYIGATIIDTNTCNTSHSYVNDSAQTDVFKEVLLYDPDNDIVVYTSLLEEGASGFDNNTHDFQMLVGENGHNADVQTTTYFFYLEIG